MPESIEVHRLSVPDERAILEWTKGKTDGYAEHLRNVCARVNDDRVLEYGIFRNGNMIGAVGCGIDSAHEFSLNNCINILLDERDDELLEGIDLRTPIVHALSDMIASCPGIEHSAVHDIGIPFQNIIRVFPAEVQEEMSETNEPVEDEEPELSM